MSVSKPRLAIADPSLVDARGHHYYLSKQVTLGANRLGQEVVWFTHEDFDPTHEIAGVTSVHPVFLSTMYDRYRPEKKDNLPKDMHQGLLDALLGGIKAAGLGQQDHVFFHTGFADVYRALEIILEGPEYWRLPYLHICTPYDLATMPGKDPKVDMGDVFKRLRMHPEIDKKVFFWAETPQLARHYTMNHGINTRALPLSTALPEVLPGKSTAKRKPDCVTALYLGAAREEKGFTLLPELVESLYEKYGKTGKLKFVIQCTPQIIGYLPVITMALDKLKTFPSFYVTLLDTVLDEQEYHDNLMASDVLLLLYSNKTYRIRGSGIAVEAVCGDKCLLTFEETFCASLLTHGGGKAVHNMEAATAALASMVDQRDTYTERANRQGREYRKKYNVKKYVERLLGQTLPGNLVPFFPSSISGHIPPQLLKLRK